MPQMHFGMIDYVSTIVQSFRSIWFDEIEISRIVIFIDQLATAFVVQLRRSVAV
jgi:hypothetical protein